jgi:hypothetical protein
MSWVRRAVTQDGHGLYAPEGVCSCPEFVMATLAELAEHGIKGQDPVADAVAALGALPVPVGTAPLSPQGPARTMLDHARKALNARMTKDDLRLVLENVVTYGASLEARVAELIQQRDRIANDTIKALAASDDATHSVDEDPIAYSLTVEALHASSGAVIETPARPHETSPRPRPVPHDLPEVTP